MSSETENPWGELRQHWAESEKKERPERESWAHPNMKEIARLTNEMRNAGWRDASCCPKDGSFFLGWEPGMGLPYRCVYRGDWPEGRWDAYMDGDVWPARPQLFKLTPKTDD